MRKLLISLLILQLLCPSSIRAKEVFQEIVVKPGDTLWGIANKYLKDPRRWPEIVKYNKLQSDDPTVALPGTKIRVPLLLIKEEYRNAHLVKMVPEVRYKRKGESNWHEAHKNMTLHYKDSLRTMKGALAHVRFPSKEVVQINENTYVVIKPERILQEIELLKGTVRASHARVIMPTGTVVKPRGRRSDYQAKVRDDETEVVFVYKGKVDVTARGKTVTIPEGYGTEVPKFSPPKDPIPLTKDFDPAEMTAFVPNSDFALPKNTRTKKNDSIKIPSTTIDPASSKKSKSIASKGILVNYVLQLSKDESFKNITYKTTKSIGSLFDVKKANIPDGAYYMRVAFTDALGVRGKFSEASRIHKDTSAPVISNLFPKDQQRFRGPEAYCDVIGQVEGATMVAVNGEVVFISLTGRFNKFIGLQEGKNTIHVMARDVNGNETVVERTVLYSKAKK